MRNIIQFCVLFRDGNRVRISIQSLYRTRASLRVELVTDFRGGDCKDPCARAHVEKTSTTKISVDGLQAETRRFMGAGAKSHARIDANDDRVSTASGREGIVDFNRVK